MAKPITLFTTDNGTDVLLVSKGRRFVFQVGGDEDDEPALTADEWGRVAVQLLVKCPDSRNPLGLASAVSTGLAVEGKTLGNRRKWTASLVEIGGDYNGRMLLAWQANRPLALCEIGAAFKAMIKELDDRAKAETWE